MDVDNNQSLASTTKSEVDAEEEWPVKQILSEGQVDGCTKYLIEWEGYDLHEATWEPKENLNPSSLEEWEETKRKQNSGKIPTFDIDEWRTAVIQQLKIDFARRERRHRKSRRRGVVIQPITRELKNLIADINATPTDQPKGTSDGTLKPCNRDSQCTILQHTTCEGHNSDKRSRRSSLDALFSDSDSEMENEGASDPCGPVDKETTSPNHTTEPVTADNTVNESFDQQPAQLQQLFAGIAIEPTKIMSHKNVPTAHEPHTLPKPMPDIESDLGSDVMDIDEASCKSSPTNASLKSPDRQATISSTDNPQNGIFPTQKNPPQIGQHRTESRKPLHETEAVVTLEPKGNNNLKSMSEPRAKQSGKRVSFSFATAEKHSNRAEASLFVSERANKQALFATAKTLPSTRSSLEEEDCTREKSESRAKTCLIGSIRLECSFHVSSRPPKSESSFYESLMEQETFNFSYVCTAQDFLRQLRATELSSGVWVTGTACSLLQAEKLATVLDTLHSSSFGLLYRNEQLCLVIYPSKSADWQEPPLPTSPAPTGHVLRYLAFMPAANFQSKDMSLEFNPEYLSGVGIFDKQLYHKLLPTADQQTKTQPTADSFFLIFPPSAKPEEDLLCRWLRLFSKKCEIRSCVVSGHWAKFLEASRGSVILHQDCVQSLYRLPHFYKLLHSRNEDYNFWIFRLPFYSPISEPKSMNVYLEQVGIALDWAFPPGVVVLAPPSFFISQPMQAYNLLKWTWHNFSDEAPIYRNGKLVVCHGIDEWLLSLAVEKNQAMLDLREPKQTLEVRMKTFHLMQKLLEQNPDDMTSPIVCAPVHIDGNDEQSLVNWFGCWSISKIDQFRKFSAICSDNDDSRRMSRSINRSTLRGLFSGSYSPNHNRLDTERLSIKLVPSDSQKCLTTYLKDVCNNANAIKRNPLVICPWPVFQYNGESRYGDASQWVNFFAEKYISPIVNGNRQAGLKNTQLGFFYTANDDNYQSHPQDSQLAHPWVALVRPMELYKKPWRYSELLIWDYRLRDATLETQTIAESKLSSAQRHLITEVTKQYAKINLPLSKVWVGGFKASKSYSNQLDITLDWVTAAMEKVKSWLPLHHDDLLNRRWSLVRHRGTLSAEQSPAGPGIAAPSGRADTDTSEEPQRVLFNPPNAGSANAIPYTNRMYQWAVAPRVPRESEFTYVPTLEWYQDQQDSGRGFEHIHVCSWRAFFEHYKIDDPEN
ncbi:hypothetical protein PWT90_00052 [Aphanocladium album]|nr:hypothetical protein PWT90_00052 [Aphanocladium album]